MKFLYLDTMDLAHLAGDMTTNRLDQFKNTLQNARASLVLSKFHMMEAIGVGIHDAKTRFTRFLDAGIVPLVFQEDPRDAELRFLKTLIVADYEAPFTMAFRELTPDSLEQDLREAAQEYAQIREIHSTAAISEFFSVQANPGSHRVRIFDTIKQIEKALPDPDFGTRITAAMELNLSESYDEATQKRFLKKTKATIATAAERARPYTATIPSDPAQILANLREHLANEEVDIAGADCDMTWGDYEELVMIRQRGRDVCGWAVPSVAVSCMAANRIPFMIDTMRHLDIQRIAEPGDYMDSQHAMHLPFTSIMTADKRTVMWLQASKNEMIAEHAKRIFRGGNLENLNIALEALLVAPDAASRGE